MDFEMIHPDLLDLYVKNPEAMIIDLREPEDYRKYHIRNAVNIPYSTLYKKHVFPEDMILVLYCERGSSSLSAAKMLTEQGYNVKTVVGGIHAYRGNMIERY
ncbi:MAG: rhodanese-like domain-containing protein [Eubacteriales bacterium]|nr:rhodanese-like domain-containing protein [Eubacteriales bacterium]